MSSGERELRRQADWWSGFTGYKSIGIPRNENLGCIRRKKQALSKLPKPH